ncbi:MAG: acyl-CoA dehydratase activase-related protein [Actinobacteria bacterium]|nr:acyl-CoA dehydratase activase-related protein [Actinomycetota bacterium]
MTVTVGIPRTLAYYTYYPLWKTFLEELGVRVVVSSRSTKKTLDAGVRETVNDACVPIKLFHGHVRDLVGKVDYLFIPRLVNVRARAVFCPKFLGLPDMVRHSMANLPPIIDVRVDLRKGRTEFFKICYRVSRVFTNSFGKFLRAYLRATAVWRRYQRLLREGFTPPEAFRTPPATSKRPDLRVGEISDERLLRLAVLGYPYAIYDPYISLELIEKLQGLGAEVITAEMLPARDLRRQSSKFSKELFWTYSDLVVRAGYHFLEKGGVDGIIHVTAFGCGPDSMVDKMLELEAKRRSTVPFMSLMIDEQTGEAGFLTRLEAFVDMLRRKEAAVS